MTVQLQNEFAQVRLTAMCDALSAQRNNAMNEVANLAAEVAMLKAVIEKQNVALAETGSKSSVPASQKSQDFGDAS